MGLKPVVYQRLIKIQIGLAEGADGYDAIGPVQAGVAQDFVQEFQTTVSLGDKERTAATMGFERKGGCFATQAPDQVFQALRIFRMVEAGPRSHNLAAIVGCHLQTREAPY